MKTPGPQSQQGVVGGETATYFPVHVHLGHMGQVLFLLSSLWREKPSFQEVKILAQNHTAGRGPWQGRSTSSASCGVSYSGTEGAVSFADFSFFNLILLSFFYLLI